MIDKQRGENGEASITTVLFDDQYEVLFDNVDIKKVSELTNKEYYARGMTALLDAIGKTVNQVAARHNNSGDSAVPAKTVVVIITDGMENASKEYKLQTVKAMIEKQKNEFGWEFVFMGANIDAISVAGSMGIDASRAANYHADGVGTATNFVAVGKMFTSVRKGNSVADNWKEEIDKDYNSRKK
ncbi:MAG: hypothetical protein ACI4JK_05985 [Oscillospiraceae bacterium]